MVYNQILPSVYILYVPFSYLAMIWSPVRIVIQLSPLFEFFSGIVISDEAEGPPVNVKMSFV